MNKETSPGDSRLQAAEADPEHGTESPAASLGREVGARTPERVHEEQIRKTGHEDDKAQGNRQPEMAPKQTSGAPAELDRVPLDKPE